MPFPMRKPMASPGEPDDLPPEDPMAPDAMDDGGGDDTDALLEELQRAEDAGEQYSADNFFAPVPGAEPDAGGANGGELDAHGQDGQQMDPEKLQQLLQMLEQAAPTR